MNEAPSPQRVVVTDVRMPFWSMVPFMVKWAIAAIPRLAWRRRCILVLLAISLGTAGPSLATEGALTRNANLRRDPSTASPPLRRLAPPDEVEVIDPKPVNGYYHVRDEDNEQGWVWHGSLRIVPDVESPVPAAPKVLASPVGPADITSSISPDWDKPDPNRTTFEGADGSCGPTGDGGDTETNRRKNRTDISGSYHDVTWDAVASLDYPVAPKSRASWTPAQLAQIAPYEGTALRVVGYLVALKPQKGGSGESTNCHFTNDTEVDWHIALVGQVGDGEKDAVVVETTPRIRQSHSHWTPQALRPWLNADTPVRISGWLLLDPEHRNHLKRYRSTLWEIHPITKIEVFQSGEWKDLDKE